MRKWEPNNSPELIPTPIDARQYEENLAEIAELLYIFCKKTELKSISVSPTKPGARVHHDRGQQKEARS